MIKDIPNYEKLHNDYVKEMNKINKIKRNRKNVNKLLAPPKKKFIRKKNKGEDRNA